MYRTKTKLKLFDSIASYNQCCFTGWTLTKCSEKRLQVFQQKCLRRILGIFYPNLVRNAEVLRRSCQRDVITEIVDRKL
jgi:hypothetical protein